MLIPNQGDRDLPSYTKPNDVHFQYSKNETSHTYQTSSPARKRRICGVSRQTRTYITLIDLQHFFTLYTFYIILLVLLTPFSSYHGVLQTTTFGCRSQHKAYSCRRISNGSAHGPSMHEFTSPFYSIAYSSFGPFSQMSSEECTNVLCLKIAVLAAHLY